VALLSPTQSTSQPTKIVQFGQAQPSQANPSPSQTFEVSFSFPKMVEQFDHAIP